MRVNVLFFGVLKELAAKSSDTLHVSEGASVRDVLDHYAKQLPRLQESMASLAVAVNQEYSDMVRPLEDGDEVALLPPVSGGSGDAVGNVLIVRSEIDTSAVLARIKRGEDGALVVFEGIVRNETRARRTLFLEYEAYESMALRQMEGLASQALEQFRIRDVALIHRLGRIEISETSVLIVVASAHRAEAFDACRWLIDTLKRTVPIWKKEYFEDGAVWSDGEPFPAEIPRAEPSRIELSRSEPSR